MELVISVAMLTMMQRGLEDHVRIRDRVSNIQDTWLMTYDNHEEIKKLYSNYRSRTYDLNYSAGAAAKGTEIMIYSDDVSKLQ